MTLLTIGNEDPMIVGPTRAQAIERNQQYCLSQHFELVGEYYNLPIYCTSRVWELIQSDQSQDLLRDILVLTCQEWLVDERSTLISIKVVAPGLSIPPNCGLVLPAYELFMQHGTVDFDDPRDALTLMFPDEH